MEKKQQLFRFIDVTEWNGSRPNRFHFEEDLDFRSKDSHIVRYTIPFPICEDTRASLSNCGRGSWAHVIDRGDGRKTFFFLSLSFRLRVSQPSSACRSCGKVRTRWWSPTASLAHILKHTVVLGYLIVDRYLCAFNWIFYSYCALGVVQHPPGKEKRQSSSSQRERGRKRAVLRIEEGRGRKKKKFPFIDVGRNGSGDVAMTTSA